MGFLERVYENALTFELKRSGLLVEFQKVYRVKYQGAIVGDYQTDLVVPEKIIVE
jgi:GxxExxY protein